MIAWLRRNLPALCGGLEVVSFFLVWQFPDWPGRVLDALYLVGSVAGLWFGYFLVIDILIRMGRLDPKVWKWK